MIGSDDDGSDDNAHDPYMMRLKAQAAEEDAGNYLYLAHSMRVTS